MKDGDLAWFAGLFEGEGNIYRNDKRRQFIMAIKMNDEDIIRRVQEVTNCGRIHRRASMWEWVCTKTNDILRLANLITPFMGERRTRQIIKAIEGKSNVKEHRLLREAPPPCNYLEEGEITNRGAKKHVRNGERPCSICAGAQRRYLQQWRTRIEANP